MIELIDAKIAMGPASVVIEGVHIFFNAFIGHDGVKYLMVYKTISGEGQDLSEIYANFALSLDQFMPGIVVVTPEGDSQYESGSDPNSPPAIEPQADGRSDEGPIAGVEGEGLRHPVE